MDEPLLGDRRLALDLDLQARLATVRAQLPGPAGTAVLELGGAIDLDVDVADPAGLAGLTVELPVTGNAGRLPRSTIRRLDVLLGPERTAQLAAAAVASAEAGGGHGPRSLAGHGRAGVAPAFQRAALAQAAACEAGAPRLVRAVGLLEAAVALDSLASHGFLDLRAVAHRDAEVGAELLVELASRKPLPRAGRPTGAALAALLGEVQRVVDAGSVVARAVAVLAAELERGEHPEHVSGMTVAHAGRPEPVGELSVVAGDAPDVRQLRQLRQPRLARRIPVDVHALPGSLTEVAVAARRSAPCEVEVRLDGGAERRYGLWARAFDADDDTLVGIAPFVRDSSVAADAVARVLVPPAAGGHSHRRIEVDVTDRPEMPRPSPAFSLVERARYQGTRAARAERLGDRVQARYRWSRCARLWEAAGDQRRAAQAGARAVAAPAIAAPAVGPLVCDLVYGC